MIIRKAQQGWSFDDKSTHIPGVDLPSLDDFKSFELPSAYDFEYWRSNNWKYVDERDLGQEDFNAIVAHAISIIDPEIFSYNKEAAFASALELAIWSMEQGKYQAKIHPKVFQEMIAKMNDTAPKTIKVDSDKVPQNLKMAAKMLALSDELRSIEASPSLVKRLEEENMNRKQAADFAKRVDKVADQVREARPDLAKRLWVIADWLEGDKDETRFMKRYDYTGTYEQDSDEKYMKEYDDMPNEAARHSEVARRTEGPVKDLNTKPEIKNPHESGKVVDYHWATCLKQASSYLDKLAGWVENQGDKDLALKIDQINDNIDAELKTLE